MSASDKQQRLDRLIKSLQLLFLAYLLSIPILCSCFLTHLRYGAGPWVFSDIQANSIDWRVSESRPERSGAVPAPSILCSCINDLDPDGVTEGAVVHEVQNNTVTIKEAINLGLSILSP